MLAARRTIVSALVALLALALAAGAPPVDAAVVKVSMTARHRTVPLMPGLRFAAWTFNRSIPGPVVRAREGDTIEITLRNADRMHRHSLDFHASQVDPLRAMADVPPGKTRTFSFVARRPGVFLYHCGTSSVLQHVGQGMYGAIIIEPAGGRPPAQEIILVQSELYGRVRGRVLRSTLKDMLAMRPRYTAFNGSPFRYLRRPLQVRAGEPVRIYLVDAGPSMGSAFHVVGEIFDAVQPDGNPVSPREGVSTWSVPAGAGAVFELTFDEPGTYTFLTHELGLAMKGAVGRIVAR
ncbi:MAG: multicopper oxidase domain-containing protein [Solirubrobacteraceae bacterium]|nr:multicopper oxidase domain-containing protein [Solirubrobacteraceae bacterium]